MILASAHKKNKTKQQQQNKKGRIDIVDWRPLVYLRHVRSVDVSMVLCDRTWRLLTYLWFV